MFNVCRNCGKYRAEKLIEPDGPFAVCPECGYKHAFLRLPLLIVSGASGTGKSTTCQQLVGKVTEAVLLDSDILWTEGINPENNYRSYFEQWLRLCKNISQSGRPVVLFGAGFGVPNNVEPRIERRYFSAVHYLALTCDDEVLAKRLQARPKGRKGVEKEFVEEHVNFNRWFKDSGGKMEPPITLIDNTALPLDQSAVKVAAWIGERIAGA